MIAYRVFISSPGDVHEERLLAARVLERLRLKWGRRVRLEAVFWEQEPLAADASFQAQIPDPGDCDVMVTILWSRVGTPLPADVTRADGSRYQSGTEYEIERALAAHAKNGRPELLVYHKVKPATARLDGREALEERWRQKQSLDELIDRLFQNADGSAARARHSFEESEELEELLREHLDKLILRRIEAESGGEASARESSLWQGSPFRGLSVFQPEDATIFCGRSARVRQILDALRDQHLRGRPFVLVVGASGSGKSSLVRSGVIPRLTGAGVVPGVGVWRRAIWVPGTSEDPFVGLAQALLADDAIPELAASGTGAMDLATDLRERPGAAVSRLRLGLQEAARAERRRKGSTVDLEVRLALVVDQTEELFTHEGIGAPERTRLDAALAALAASDVAWVIATLRSDFYDRFTELPELMRLKEGSGQYDLPAPEPEEIGRMIREPAEIAGLHYEREPESGRRLDDVLRDAAVADPGALPLLEFTLDALYRRCEETGTLTFAAYRAMGGLDGALAHRADEVYGGLSAQAREALDPVLLSLVRLAPEPDSPPSRRRAARTALAAIPGGRELVEAFVADRLLTADRGSEGEPVVSVTHEALLRAWPRAVEWRERHAGMLRARARIEAQAATWAAEEEAAGYLLPEGQLLAEGRGLLDHPGGALGTREERFVRASAGAAAERHRRRTLRRRWAAGAILATACAGALAWYLFYRPYVSWYSALRFRDGVPEGVGVSRVDASQRSRRWWTYRVERRGRLGRVEALAAVDSHGRPTYFHDFSGFLGGPVSGGQLDLRDPRQTIARESRWELDYEGGEVSRLRALDRLGNPVYVLEYKGPRRGDRRELTGEYTRDGIASPQAESGAAVVKTLWRDDGLLERMWYLDANGRRRPDRNLSWGMKVEELDRNGLPIKLTSLGPDDRPAPNRSGWAKAELRYEDGLLSRADFFDPEGRPVLTRDGYARLHVERDADGNPLVERYDDEQGNPMPGIAEVHYAYDSAARLATLTFLSADDRAMADDGGVYGRRFEYTDDGDLARLYLLGPDGGPLQDPPFGYSGIALRWAEPRTGERGPRGLAAVTYLDAGGDPVVPQSEADYVTEAYKYDASGDLIEIRYLDGKGRDVRALGGYARVVMSYDEHGRRVEQAYRDENGLPAADLTGCASWHLSYDAQGNPVERRCHDREGNPDFGGLGAIWRTRYDDSGLPVEDRFFDLDDQPYNAVLGCWIADLRDGTPGQDLERVLPMVVARLRAASLGKPVPFGQSCSQVTVRYDDRGAVERREYFTAPDRPVAYELGCDRVRVRHDFRGREVERICLDPRDRATPSRWGWTRVEVSYDAEGRSEESYLDAQDQPVPLPRAASAAVILASVGSVETPARATSEPESFEDPSHQQAQGPRPGGQGPGDRATAQPGDSVTVGNPPPPQLPSSESSDALAAAVATLDDLTERIQGEYEEFLEAAHRDPEGEEEQIEEAPRGARGRRGRPRRRLPPLGERRRYLAARVRPPPKRGGAEARGRGPVGRGPGPGRPRHGPPGPLPHGGRGRGAVARDRGRRRNPSLTAPGVR